MTKETFYARLRELIILCLVGLITAAGTWWNNSDINKVNRNVRKGNAEVQEVKQDMEEVKTAQAVVQQMEQIKEEVKEEMKADLLNTPIE